jgi:hypothetical protein
MIPAVLSMSETAITVGVAMYCLFVLLLLLREWPTENMTRKLYLNQIQDEVDLREETIEYGARSVEFSSSECILSTETIKYTISFRGINETRHVDGYYLVIPKGGHFVAVPCRAFPPGDPTGDVVVKLNTIVDRGGGRTGPFVPTYGQGKWSLPGDTELSPESE